MSRSFCLTSVFVIWIGATLTLRKFGEVDELQVRPFPVKRENELKVDSKLLYFRGLNVGLHYVNSQER